ncbi:hypothetical protein [uncultured Rikenella sp.]|uniref:hypothetical protein n=1 Tax=uncultured Rikenella sp. TaxID=368003 RepID=UPI0026152C6B|nr:hypothetical protein [uncultured Rikenella sp.]
MKAYEVLAPVLVFGLHGGNGTQDYTLKRGDIVELPEEHVAVRAMLARKQIRAAEAAKPTKSKK